MIEREHISIVRLCSIALLRISDFRYSSDILNHAKLHFGSHWTWSIRLSERVARLTAAVLDCPIVSRFNHIGFPLSGAVFIQLVT